MWGRAVQISRSVVMLGAGSCRQVWSWVTMLLSALRQVSSVLLELWWAGQGGRSATYQLRKVKL